MHSLDIFATVAALAKASVPASHQLEGVDLLPYFDGTKTTAPHERLFWRMGGGTKFAVREGDWKLVAEEPQRVQLFNLAADVSESNDIAAARPEVLARLQQAYNDWNKLDIAPAFESPRAKQLKKPAK